MSCGKSKAKAEVVVPVAGRVPVAISRPTVPGVVVPTATPNHPVRAFRENPSLHPRSHAPRGIAAGTLRVLLKPAETTDDICRGPEHGAISAPSLSIAFLKEKLYCFYHCFSDHVAVSIS